MNSLQVLSEMLGRRLDGAARESWRAAAAEAARGVNSDRFCILLAMASRYARRSKALAPDAAELARAQQAIPGWSPQRWSLLDAVRVSILWSRSDLTKPTVVEALEEAFRYADEGELVALYRSLQGLPDGKRFAWRAGEGCRSNMRTVFEANVLDTAYPAACFDELPWRQAVVKCLFVGAPLWRLHGLDGRLSPELARMVLDLVEERRSAHRAVPHELWLCLGTHGGERGLAALEAELAGDNPLGRCAAIYGLARAGAADRVQSIAERDRDPAATEAARDALAGNCSQLVFRKLDSNESKK